ncbi:MAG: DUF4097 domain-containing protein [Clostridiales Family XIII bacterium]|jgi:hypothetical protein|nr:DUF4097 domain-containing protein [Clostridiales Family XIII bacterium]
MKKVIWIPLVIIIVGICLAGAGWAADGINVLKPGIFVDKDGLHANKSIRLITVDETYPASSVKSIAINVDYLNRVIVKEGEAGGKITVNGANYETNGGLASTLSDGALSVATNDPKHRSGWIINFGLSSVLDNNKCYLEITVPKGTRLEGLTADIDASDIELSGLTADTALIDNNYGDIGIRNINAGNLTIKADAGNIEADGIAVTALFDIDNHYGDVTMDRLTLAGLCRVDSDAGNVSIGLTNPETEVGYDLTVDAGSITAGGSTHRGAGNVSLNSPDISGEKAHVTAGNNFGDITLEFGR